MEEIQPTLEQFVELLERCKAQVAKDPTGITHNPHLHGALHRIYLRLCHGNIPEYGVPISPEE